MTRQRPVKDQHQIAGTAIGAVVGGLLGNQIGGGTGKKIATVAGAVGGGYAGNKVQEGMQERDTYTTTETRCSTVHDSSEKVVGYDVKYMLDGKAGQIRMERDPGSQIPVDKNGRLILSQRNAALSLTVMAPAGAPCIFMEMKTRRQAGFFVSGGSALQRRRQVRLDGGQQCLEAFGVAGDDVTLLEEFVAAGEVAHQAAGFLYQQGACRHVPFGQAEFPEGIVASGGDVGQVQAGGAGAADAGGLADQAAGTCSGSCRDCRSGCRGTGTRCRAGRLPGSCGR